MKTHNHCSKRSYSLLLLLSPILLIFLLKRNNQYGQVEATVRHPSARSIQIMNESGHRCEIHWVEPQSGERVLQTTPFIYHGASFSLNSFTTHHFEVRELPGTKSGVCGDGDGEQICRSGTFTVNENTEQIVFIRQGLNIVHTDSKSVARDSANNMLDHCQKRALSAVEKGTQKTEGAISDLIDCVQSSVADQLEKSNAEITYQSTIRKKMADLLENYTCADEELPTTEAEETREWVRNGESRQVQVLHERSASKIHLVSNIITEEECKAMEEAAKPMLHKATVADGSGGSEYSPSRKAMQAGIVVPWHLEAEGNPIATVSRKVYDYANHVLGLDIKENGQEDLMSIQYFGKGKDAEEPDRYMPHCDGDCGGLDFKYGNRMATMVMYCEVADVGGATNFRNSGLHVVPERLSGTFFSYIDTETMKMDTGFTEHSGCPVVEGEKKIVTQWIRLGVDDDNPWDSFNTLGIKHSDAANQ